VVARGFAVIYTAASASWLVSLFASPALGILLNAVAAYGFWRIAQGIDEWSRQRRHLSYGLAAVASRGAALATAALALGVAPLSSHATDPVETWGARVLLYAMWTGLWMLYYYVLQVRLEDLGAERPLAERPLAFTALGASILLSPVLTEGLPAPPGVKLALAASMYAGYMPPLNASALLAALLAQRR
jgi:hypothetical protein